MDDKNHNLDSLRRVLGRLRKLSGDDFSDSMVEILERELARNGLPGEDCKEETATTSPVTASPHQGTR